MSGQLTPEDREFLREHRAVIDVYVAGVMSAADHIGPISFESLVRSVSPDHAAFATAARLVKKTVDAAQPKPFE